MVSQFMILFMILPLAIPASIASYAVVGEKKTRSLEPLLATPIKTVELLAGKGLAALLPAVLATYFAFLVFVIGTRLLIPNDLFFSAVVDPRWLLAVIVVGPLLALMAVSFSMMVSSRVNEPRVAEQISMVLILPMMAIMFAQIAGLFVIDSQLVIVFAVLLAVLDAILAYMAVRVFQREAILTRWK
jgi:ABC-2 type transport system permease protein